MAERTLVYVGQVHRVPALLCYLWEALRSVEALAAALGWKGEGSPTRVLGAVLICTSQGKLPTFVSKLLVSGLRALSRPRGRAWDSSDGTARVFPALLMNCFVANT